MSMGNTPAPGHEGPTCDMCLSPEHAAHPVPLGCLVQIMQDEKEERLVTLAKSGFVAATLAKMMYATLQGMASIDGMEWAYECEASLQDIVQAYERHRIAHDTRMAHLITEAMANIREAGGVPKLHSPDRYIHGIAITPDKIMHIAATNPGRFWLCDGTCYRSFANTVKRFLRAGLSIDGRHYVAYGAVARAVLLSERAPASLRHDARQAQILLKIFETCARTRALVVNPATEALANKALGKINRSGF